MKIFLLLFLLPFASCGKLYITQKQPLVVDHKVGFDDMSENELRAFFGIMCRQTYIAMPESNTKDQLVEDCVEDNVRGVLDV